MAGTIEIYSHKYLRQQLVMTIRCCTAYLFLTFHATRLCSKHRPFLPSWFALAIINTFYFLFVSETKTLSRSLSLLFSKRARIFFPKVTEDFSGCSCPPSVRHTAYTPETYSNIYSAHGKNKHICTYLTSKPTQNPSKYKSALYYPVQK